MLLKNAKNNRNFSMKSVSKESKKIDPLVTELKNPYLKKSLAKSNSEFHLSGNLNNLGIEDILEKYRYLNHKSFDFRKLRRTHNLYDEIKCPKFRKLMRISEENSENDSHYLSDSSRTKNIKINKEKIKSLILLEKQKLNLKRIHNIKV